MNHEQHPEKQSSIVAGVGMKVVESGSETRSSRSRKSGLYEHDGSAFLFLGEEENTDDNANADANAQDPDYDVESGPSEKGGASGSRSRGNRDRGSGGVLSSDSDGRKFLFRYVE